MVQQRKKRRKPRNEGRARYVIEKKNLSEAWRREVREGVAKLLTTTTFCSKALQQRRTSTSKVEFVPVFGDCVRDTVQLWPFH